MSKHIQENIIKMMEEWVTWVGNSQLGMRLALLSYKGKLWTGLQYGLVTLRTPLEQTRDIQEGLNFRALPILSINRNVQKQWRTLP